MPEVVASFVLLGWVVVLMAVAYRVGKESKACCFRHGHDSPKFPPPKLPGMQLKPVNEGRGEVRKFDIVFVSDAAKEVNQ